MRSVEEIRQNSQVQIVQQIRGVQSGIGGYLRLRDSKHTMSLVAGIDTYQGEQWEHVSVAYMDSLRKTPTWEEMCAVKEIFWRPDEEVHQIHPREQDYVHGVGNLQNALHLWRPAGGWESERMTAGARRETADEKPEH